MEYIVVLVGDYILYGVVYAEGRYQQSRTAADTDYHHEETFLVTENVPQGNLAQEGKPLPDEAYTLQQNSLAHGGGFRSYKLGRHLRHFSVAGEKGTPHGAQKSRQNGQQPQPPVDYEDYIGSVIHHSVSVPYYPREGVGA